MVVLVNVRGTLGDPLPTDFLLRLALKLWLEVHHADLLLDLDGLMLID